MSLFDSLRFPVTEGIAEKRFAHRLPAFQGGDALFYGVKLFFQPLIDPGQALALFRLPALVFPGLIGAFPLRRRCIRGASVLHYCGPSLLRQ